MDLGVVNGLKHMDLISVRFESIMKALRKCIPKQSEKMVAGSFISFLIHKRSAFLVDTSQNDSKCRSTKTDDDG